MSNRITSGGLCCALLLGARTVAASEPEPSPDGVVVAPAPLDRPGPRPWLYLDDPTIPRPFTVTAHTAVTYSTVRPSVQPLTFDVAHRGGVLEAGAEVGLLPWLALTTSGYGAGSDGRAGVIGGVRFSLTKATSPTHVLVSVGGTRDLAGDAGAWGSAAFEQDLGRARIGASFRGSHTFAAGRDALDVTASAAASYNVTGPLRVGVEWIGQDLEGVVDDEAEGGVRHFAGPTASLELLGQRLSIVAGPAFGLSTGSPPFVARLSLAYAF